MATAGSLDYFIRSIWQGGPGIAEAGKSIGGLGQTAKKTDLELALARQNTAKYASATRAMAKEVNSGGISMEAAESKLAAMRTELGIGETATRKSGMRFTELKAKLDLASAAISMTKATFTQLWGALEEGAALNLAKDRFDNLTASIGTTSEALMTGLSAATGGMVSNAELMSSATSMISLGLAKSQQEVIDIVSLSSQLGWDQQQLVMTLSNNSVMRLDALGLGMDDVKKRAKELEAQGYSTDKAFDMAVIQAGQAKLELLGSAADTGAGAMQRMEVATTNMKDALLSFIAMRSEGAIVGAANAMDAVGEASAAGHSNLRNFAVIFAEINRIGSGNHTWADDWVANLEAQEAQTVDTVRAYTYLIDQYAMAAEGQRLAAEAAGYSAEKFAEYWSLESMYGRAGEEAADSAAHAWYVRQEAVDAYSATLAGGYGMENQYYEAAMRTAEATGLAADMFSKAAAAAAAEEAALSATFVALSGNEEALATYATIMSGADGATESLNEKLFAQIEASGASASSIALAGVALGVYTEAEAQSMVKSALLEEAIRKQAESWDGTAEGLATIQGNIEGYIGVLNGIPDVINTTVSTDYQTTGTPPWAGGQQYGDTGGPGGRVGGETTEMAAGGVVTGGVWGRDSVPALLMPGERVLTVAQNRDFEAGQLGGRGGDTYNITTRDNTAAVVQQLRARSRMAVITGGM